MTITISHWIFPILITIAIWGAAELKTRMWPSYGFSGFLDSYVAAALALFGTLVTWLGYFAWLAWSLS